MAEFQDIRFPVYLMKGDIVQVDGSVYVMPEPMACNTPKDLILYIYEKGLKPHRQTHS